MKKIILAFAILSTAACGPSADNPAETLVLPGAESGQLSELGFHASQKGKIARLDFREYGSESTQSLHPAHFPNIPVITGDDFFLLYGDFPEGPLGTSISVFQYVEDQGEYRRIEPESSIESFFSRTPLDPVRGTSVTKFVPRPTISDGLYFLHRWVGLSGEAYLAFRIDRQP